MLRKATMDDAETLFRWRNDPLTRQNSFTTDEVPWESHIKWLEASFQNPNRALYIAECGTVRADIQGDRVELSWTVAPEIRGKGFGKAMVACAVSLYPDFILTASIKPGNVASEKIAESAGFHLASRDKHASHWLIRARCDGAGVSGSEVAADRKQLDGGDGGSRVPAASGQHLIVVAESG